MTITETKTLLENGVKNEGKTYIIFHDTETTGIKKLDRILQSAHALYEVNSNGIEFIDFLEENILPPVAIGPASAAVHGIWYPDLEGCPSFDISKSKDYFDIFIELGVYYCAHNSDFDIAQLEKEGIYYPADLVIDTLQIAKHFNAGNENIESNGLQYLRYFYNFDMASDFESFLSDYGIKKLQPHTALSDIAVLAYYFKELIKFGAFSSVEEAVSLTNTAVISNELKFGNVFEKGSKISDCLVAKYKQYGKTKRGVDYFNWAMTNMDNLSPDIKISISKHAMDKVIAGELSFIDKALTPMKYIAATFLPEFYPFLKSNGFDVENAKESVLLKIKKRIQEVESNAMEDDARDYANLVKILKYAK